MKLKNYPFQIKVDAEKRTFEGYASTWDIDLENDQILPGAFKKSIDERLPYNKIKILYNHQDAIGVPIEMGEDEKGLYVKGKISNTTLGNDVINLMADNVISEMSIGFDIISDREPENGIRKISEVKLWEVSPVIFGANPHTSIFNVQKRFADMVEIVKHEQKEGRVLSAVNKRKLEEVVEILQSILVSIDKEPEPKSLDVDLHAMLRDMREYSRSYLHG